MDKVTPARRKQSEPNASPNAAAAKQHVALAAPKQAGANSKKSAGSYILSPPKGPRTVSHKRIERAVKSVLRREWLRAPRRQAPEPPRRWQDRLRDLTGHDVDLCRGCGGRMLPRRDESFQAAVSFMSVIRRIGPEKLGLRA